MTEDLLRLKGIARGSPGRWVMLVTKGVGFGEILYDERSGSFDTSRVRGIDEDMVVRPFGRPRGSPPATCSRADAWAGARRIRRFRGYRLRPRSRARRRTRSIGASRIR